MNYYKVFTCSLFALFLSFSVPGCGGSGGDAEFQETEPITQEQEQYAEDYEKMLEQQEQENYGK